MHSFRVTADRKCGLMTCGHDMKSNQSIHDKTVVSAVCFLDGYQSIRIWGTHF